MHDDKYGNGRIGGVAGDEWGPYERKEFHSIPGRLLHLAKSIFMRSRRSPYVAGLVAPRGRNAPDGLSRWIAEELIPSFHDVKDLWSKRKDKADVEHRSGDKSRKPSEGKDQKKEQGRPLDKRVVSQWLTEWGPDY